MADELAKVEPGMLESITDALGSNMAMEKAVIHDHVVKDNAYETAMQTSALLLKIGYNLISNLNGQSYKTNFGTSCGIAGCSSYLDVRGEKMVIDIAHDAKECQSPDYQLSIFPKKDKIRIKLKEERSNLKFGTALGITGVTFLASPFVLFVSPIVAGLLFAVSMGTGFGIGIKGDDKYEKYGFHINFKPQKLFSRLYTLNKTEWQINAFLDDYCSLPGRVYSAVEHWITQNQDVNKRLDKRREEFAKLEERLR